MQREYAILVTLIVYKALLVAVGLFAQRRTKSEVDFFLGGRGLGATVAAISASASSSSAWTLLGVSGAAYAWGLSAVWIFPACVGGFVINWCALAPTLQRVSYQREAVTVTEVLAGPRDRPLHRPITVLASTIILVSLSAYVAAQFQGAGKTFNQAFGLSVEASILVGAGIVLFYTLAGGFWAVSITDTLQGLVMAATAVMLPVAALVEVGGLGGLANGLESVAVPGFTSLTRDLGGPAAIGFVLGLLGIGLGYPGQPHVVNRFMALKQGEGILQRARIAAIAWGVVVYAGMLILGLCGRVLLPDLPDKEQVFLAVTNHLFSPWVAGVMVAAVLSAVMSTADSQLLVAASAVTRDLKIGATSDTSLLARSRIATLLLTLVAVLAALTGSREIFSRVLFAWAAMGCAFGPLLLAVVIKGTVTPRRTLGAMTAGFVLSVAAYSIPAVKSGLTERVVPFVVALGIALWPKPNVRSGDS